MESTYYIKSYVDNFIKVFRQYNTSKLKITITGFTTIADRDIDEIKYIVNSLNENMISIQLDANASSMEMLNIHCEDIEGGYTFSVQYHVNNLPSLLDLSSRTNICLTGLIIMKAVANIICRYKILYKAIVLDLDETLWNGTLSEVGVEGIKRQLKSSGKDFIAFMNYIRVLSENLGVFVAICSRNDLDIVTNAINNLDYEIFPIKEQIDYIIANNNDKSTNIELIANELSILPDSMIFIDDNQIVRDEVKSTYPGVFVPNWNNHHNLLTELMTTCCFERINLSIKSQSRKKQFRIIKAEKIKNNLPLLKVQVNEDNEHNDAIELYTKSNQFNFSQHNIDFVNTAKSISLSIYSSDDEDLGICAALTYEANDTSLNIINWAMSCRFFEIGLEEYLLLLIKDIAKERKITINYNDSGLNQRTKDLLLRYPTLFIAKTESGKLELGFTNEIEEQLQNNTNLIIR